MSLGLRLIHLLLFMVGLLIVWFGIHELSQVPLGNVQGFTMVGTGMLILAWKLANPPKPLADIDANSIQAKISQRLDPLVWAAGLAIAVATLSLRNLDFYFNDYTLRNSYAYTPIMTDIGHYLQAQGGKRYTYAFTTPYLYFNYATIEFIANDPPGMDVLDPLTSITDLSETPAGLHPVFIVIPDRLNELEVVKQQYPDGELKKFSRPQLGGEVYLYIYEPRGPIHVD